MHSPFATAITCLFIGATTLENKGLGLVKGITYETVHNGLQAGK